MPYNFGDLVLVPYPFTNQTAFKQRPAVVISSRVYNDTRPDVVLMAVTSKLRSNSAFDELALAEWGSIGLLKPSAIKPILFTLEQTMVLKTLGEITSEDQSALRSLISRIIG